MSERYLQRQMPFSILRELTLFEKPNKSQQVWVDNWRSHG